VALRIGMFLAILLILAYGFAQYVRRSSMFFPARDGNWDAADGHRDVAFTASDGVRLHGWLFFARGAGAPLIVWCHGNGGNITDRAPMAAELARRGVSVLLFDWRGYGKSEGTPAEENLYLDADAAYDFAAKSLGAPPQSIIAYGESLGGPFAAHMAATHKVRCVIIENSFPSLMALGNALYRPFPLGWFAPRAMTTSRWLNAAGVPVLVIHSRADQVIPFVLGKQLFDSLRVPKEMLISETAAHCDMANTEPQRYYEAVVRFVTR
jgi:fermentation-respiration switch protein FrsA (DUF1100 family)